MVEKSPQCHGITQKTPFRIAAIYALFGALWILLSDKLLALIVHDRSTITTISLWKGWAFIAVTGWLLYRLIGRDVAERTRIENALRDDENKLRAITDAAADSIILMDDEMRVIYWNPAAVHMFGYVREEIMGQKIDRIVPERYRADYTRGHQRFLATGEGNLIGRNCEVFAVRKGGVEFPVELSLSSVRLMDRWHAAAIIKDISERKILENRLRHAQKMEAIGTLAGGIAHDFNNILTAIIGFGSLTRMNLAEQDRLVPYVDNILTAADRAAELTRSLLSFSRNQPIESKPVNLNEVVRGTEKLLVRLLCKEVEFRVELSEEPLVVLADSGQIVQVLMNLASNAADAMPEGGAVTLGSSRMSMDDEFIRAHGYGKHGSYALLSFCDNGLGMDDETQQRIFEPFFSTKGVGKGTGLGLSSAYGIVKQHNGFISCYSWPGKGTTFSIYLPIMELTGLAAETDQFLAPGRPETAIPA